MMEAAKSTHGLCTECLSKGTLNLLTQKKPNHCTHCQKQAQVLFDQNPYCASCYLQTISSPTKSDMSSQKGHLKTKSFYRPLDKEQVRNMKKSFLSSTGKLIKKISRLFEQNESQSQLISYLNKKAVSMGNMEWDKLIPKVNKNSNIIYLFFGKTKVIGAFHAQSVNIEGESSVWDQQSGIFYLDKYKNQPEFARVKTDSVTYSCKNKSIKFGSPSSFQILFQKNSIKVTSELTQDFEPVVHSFIYRP